MTTSTAIGSTIYSVKNFASKISKDKHSIRSSHKYEMKCVIVGLQGSNVRMSKVLHRIPTGCPLDHGLKKGRPGNLCSLRTSCDSQVVASLLLSFCTWCSPPSAQGTPHRCAIDIPKFQLIYQNVPCNRCSTKMWHAMRHDMPPWASRLWIVRIRRLRVWRWSCHCFPTKRNGSELKFGCETATDFGRHGRAHMYPYIYIIILHYIISYHIILYYIISYYIILYYIISYYIILYHIISYYII